MQVASNLPNPSSMTPFILGHPPFSLLCLRWDASPEKGQRAVALHGTARPHGDFAFEDATSCQRHLLGNGASCRGVPCWGTTLGCGRLNLCNGEQSKEEKGMRREEKMMFWGERVLRVLLGGKARLCFIARPEIIPGGHSATRSP